MSTAPDVGVDHDIEEMLDEIARAAFPKKLILFNDDEHDQVEVLIQIMIARDTAGKPCTREQAQAIMMEAHTKGQAVVLTGELKILKTAQEVLESIGLRTDIID